MLVGFFCTLARLKMTNEMWILCKNVMVVLSENNSFFHQLGHNMTTDCFSDLLRFYSNLSEIQGANPRLGIICVQLC